MTPYDAIVIGTGQAGPALAGRLAAAGMEVAVVERHRFGGSCVNFGCTPTKALVASAHAAWMARRAPEYGLHAEGVRVDMRRVKERKDRIVAKSRDGLEKWLREEAEGVTVFDGHARFVGPRRVEVGGTVLSADRVFLNVGARALVPDIAGLEETDFLTASGIVDLDLLPRHLVVIGGSYVGLEFGQMYRRFGSEVTIVDKGPRLAAREDEDVSGAIQEILEGEGVDVRAGARCTRVKPTRGAVTVVVEEDGADHEIEGSHLLVATGRRPNTDDLALEKAGIETDDRGYVLVDDELRTSAEGVWALGDCNGRGGFTHTSVHDGLIVAANLLHGGSRRVSERIPTYGLFIDPPLGRVGQTEAEVRGSSRPALVGKRPMSRVSRAIEKGDSRGFMKVLVDEESGRLLGAAILGVGADEAVHCVTDAMYSGAPYTVIRDAVHIHPTVAELIPTVLGELEPLS
jgi:pyruvate/2-oxoglutarate dehydrogenase complex dihydrolipoamide dehydrogenase (E3) component